MRIREWRLEYEAGNKQKWKDRVITLKTKSKSSPSAIVNKGRKAATTVNSWPVAGSGGSADEVDISELDC